MTAPVPSEVAETTTGEREVEAAEGCGATRGYCACDRPKDGHRHHHCPECATHPNGGWAFSTWVDNPKIRPQDRARESMHEYATDDPWASALAEPDAGEVEALDVVTLHDKMLGLAWSCTCGAIGAGAADPIRKAARDHQRTHLAALLDRVRREEGAKVLNAVADEWLTEHDGEASHVARFLRSRAASVGRGEGL